LDQAQVENRADVLKFQTPVFNSAVYMTGALTATLYVSSDAIDTDFMVKLSDVYPTGEVRIIQDSAMRMRWRKGGVTPVYLEKGTIYEIKVSLWNTSYVVAPGHALRISVASSNWPRFSVNPNNGLLLADAAYPGANITATNTIYHSMTHKSKITIPQVVRPQLPVVHVLHEVKEAYPQLTEDMIISFSKGLANRQKEARIRARASRKH
jgi:putative CocE/NonD family hydrolase